MTNTNTLNEKMSELIEAGKTGTSEYMELRRRFGFEYDGMRLHEYYFDNLGGNGQAPTSGKLVDRVNEIWGSMDKFLADFKATGAMRLNRLGHPVPGPQHRPSAKLLDHRP